MKLFLIILIIPFSIHCQNFEVWGNVANELNINVKEVSVQNIRTKEKTSTNCNGKFRLISKLGDTLIVKKTFFLAKIYHC